MPLSRRALPFDHPEWIFELKYDGFRSLAYIDYKRFADLRDALPDEINAKDAILDGELVVLDGSGKARFYDLMANRGTVVFAAFDLMWLIGRDLRDQPLWGRKELLRLDLGVVESRSLC